MKRIASILILFLIFSCTGKSSRHYQNNSDGTVTEFLTEFEFNKEIHNFGTLIAGEKVLYNYTVKNTGGHDLVIYDVKSDCGCITINYSRDPVSPGEEAVIEIGFDSSGLFGRQYKTITVETNTKEKINYLAVLAEVVNEQIEFNY